MKLPLKLSRSRSNSPPSSVPSSPHATPSPTPAPSKKKPRFLPVIGSTKKTPKPAATTGTETAERPPTSPPSSMSTLRSSQLTAHDEGKLYETSECSLAVASPGAHADIASSSGESAVDGRVEIEQVFAQFDANGDGRISTEELQAVLACLGEKMTMEEAALMVKEVDVDGDGYIDLEEFAEMNRRCVEESALEEEMAAAFAVFDFEQTGRITAEGLQQVLQRLGGNLAQRSSVEDCRRMIRGVDRKGAGHVDFDDFKLLMTPTTF